MRKIGLVKPTDAVGNSWEKLNEIIEAINWLNGYKEKSYIETFRVPQELDVDFMHKVNKVIKQVNKLLKGK